MAPLLNLLLIPTVKRSVTVLRKALDAVVVRDASLTLQLNGVGIVKGSERWKSIYSKNRSSVERCMKRILIDYELEKVRVYSRKQWLWRIALICINIHLDAWRDYARPNIVGHLTSWAEEAA
jgi:hypothetical protein